MKEVLTKIGPIGVFDSGYGGLTILKEMQRLMPTYDFMYLGDNARAPYGSRSFDVVYQFTLEAVEKLFEQGCSLVILACNTASAKALRTIQQQDLPRLGSEKRVLGVIRPTVEHVMDVTRSGHVGVFATQGTIDSDSYPLELHKLDPSIVVSGQACPMWVPLIENGEANQPGADYFVQKYIQALLAKDALLDTIILGCTHYPILQTAIQKKLPREVNVVAQGELVAEKLVIYLQRHPDMDARLSRTGSTTYYTTESPKRFAEMASLFMQEAISAERIYLP